VTDDGDERSHRQRIFSREEVPALRRRRIEEVEKRSTDGRHPTHARGVTTPHREAPLRHRGIVGEARRAALEVQVAGVRKDIIGAGPSLVRRPEVHAIHLARLAQIGKGPEHQSVDHAEHGGVGADAERERDHHRCRETRGAPQAAERVADILQHRFDRGKPPRIAALFAQAGDVSELSACGVTRGGCGHASRLEIAREELEVRLHVVGELAVERVATDPGAEAPHDFAKRHDSAPRNTRVVAATER
jgi:hypothetical protein